MSFVGSPCYQYPTGQKGQATNRRDRTEDANTAQCKCIQATAENHDTDEHGTTGPAQQYRTKFRDQQDNSKHAERMYHLISNCGMPNSQHFSIENLFQSVRTKCAGSHGDEHVDGGQDDQKTFTHEGVPEVDQSAL